MSIEDIPRTERRSRLRMERMDFPAFFKEENFFGSPALALPTSKAASWLARKASTDGHPSPSPSEPSPPYGKRKSGRSISIPNSELRTRPLRGDRTGRKRGSSPTQRNGVPAESETDWNPGEGIQRENKKIGESSFDRLNPFDRGVSMERGGSG